MTCWNQEKRPRIINDRTKRAAALIHAVYNSPDGVCGAHAHIVIDDWNVGDSSIDFCLWHIDGTHCEETEKACREFLTLFKSLSVKERYSALAMESGFPGKIEFEQPT